MPRQTQALAANAAKSLAIEALAFLVEEPERLGRFLALTGLDPAAVRRLAREPSFFAAVLEHVAADQHLLLAFAAQTQRDPAEVDAARAVLGAGDWERDTA